MQKICKSCNQTFEITDSDLKFYEEIGVPSPNLCPDDRAKRRMAFANQRNLYLRKCDGTGKTIISNFSSDKKSPVYAVDFFFSNDWDQLKTGRDYDFSRPFFDQFNDLMQVAPKLALQRSPSFDQNSDYTNYAGKNKNCYLIFDSDKNEDCYHSYSINSCISTMDCFRVSDSELCYECVDCTNSYNCRYLQNCDNCRDCYFLKNSIGCKNCFGSVNLRNKEFYFFNEKLTKEEYEKRLVEYKINSNIKIQQLKNEYQKFILKFPNKAMEGVYNEDVFGNYLIQCKNAHNCYDSRKLWDCRYIQQAFDDAKSSIDCTQVGDAVEQLYECCYGGYGAYFNRFCSHTLGQSSYLTYCYYTPFCAYLFGCIGLHHQKYCILNKQYTKEKYEELIPKIIEHMKNTGEFGEFFPIEISPFAYNETHAFDFYPITKEEILEKGWKWKDDIYEIPKVEKTIPANLLPETINEIPDDILNWAIVETSQCNVSTNRPFKIIKPELDFYRKMNLPIPRRHPDQRHKDRMALRNPRKLWERNCMKCNDKIQTTYSPEEEIACNSKLQRRIVYCEKCYLASIV
jgi:hypothetical protein